MSIGLLLAALAFPLLELALLIKVGQWIGFWSTVLLLMATAVGGGLLVHAQGLNAGRRMMETLNDGVAPVEPLVDSFLIMVAGFLLLVPGLITDAMALVLLVPPLRAAVARWAIGRAIEMPGRSPAKPAAEWRSPGRRGPDDAEGSADVRPGPRRGPVVIDGEWERIDGPSSRSKPASGDNPPTGDGRR